MAVIVEATPDPGFRLPESDPAETTGDAVLETVQELGACIYASDFWGRLAALFTEDYLRREFKIFGPIPESERADIAAMLEPLPAEGRVALLTVVDVRALPNVASPRSS